MYEIVIKYTGDNGEPRYCPYEVTTMGDINVAKNKAIGMAAINHQKNATISTACKIY